ncbi:hypothetical protein CLF_108195, partial [Clonorchis sinensis]
MLRIRNPWLICVSIGMLMKLVKPSSDGYQKCLVSCTVQTFGQCLQRNSYG